MKKLKMERLEYEGEDAERVECHRESLPGVDILWWVTGDARLFERTLGRMLLQFGDRVLGGQDLSLEECLSLCGRSGAEAPRFCQYAAVGFASLFRLYRRYAHTTNRARALSAAEWDLLNWLEGLGYLELSGRWPKEGRPFLIMSINAAQCSIETDEDLLRIIRRSREFVAP